MADGIASESLTVFNSASCVRVRALQAVGCFPGEFPLDYLDHATFVALQQAGGRVFVMRAALRHDFSEAGAGGHKVTERTVNKFLAEERFYATHGSKAERFRRMLDLLRQAVGHGRRGHFAAARLRLRFALRALSR